MLIVEVIVGVPVAEIATGTADDAVVAQVPVVRL